MAKYISAFKSKMDIIAEYSGDYDLKYKEGSKPTTVDAIKISNDLKGAKIYIAWYGYGSYCGDSFVLYEKEGKLYEVNGSHCSCNGLEGQWEPEETSWEALAIRKFYDEYDGSDEANTELQRLVKRYKS